MYPGRGKGPSASEHATVPDSTLRLQVNEIKAATELF